MDEIAGADHWTDPIVEEVRAERTKLLEESGGTLEGMFARLRREQARESERPVLATPTTKPEQPRAEVA